MWFLVSFPVLVLAVFVWLLTTHPDKLYAPGDYEDEEHFMEVANNLWAASRKSKGQATVDSEDAIQKLRRRLNQRTRRGYCAMIVQRTTRTNAVPSRPLGSKYYWRFRQTKRYGDCLTTNILGRSYRIWAAKKDREKAMFSWTLCVGAGLPRLLYSIRRQTRPNTRGLGKAETIQHGGQACTNDPNELFEIVLDLLGSQPYDES